MDASAPRSWNVAGSAPLHAAAGDFVLVAGDEDGGARAVPPLAPRSDAERLRHQAAEIRRAHAHRLARKEEIGTGRRA